jgi:voltage-gated potassium channel
VASYEEILTPQAWKVRSRFEVPVLVAALLVVPVIFIEGRATSSTWLSVAHWANWVIWAVFLLEFVSVMWLTDSRGAYAKKAWLDVFIIVTSFPLLPVLLETTRLLRLVRLSRVLRILRLARLAAVVTRGGAAARAIFKKRGLGYIIVLTVFVAMGVGGAFSILEDAPIADSLWWAIVTMTTVGYGDVFPVTPLGRAVATILMLLGIGLLAVVTATVAAYFVEQDEGSELADFRERLDRIESLLRATLDQRGDEDPRL